MIFLVSSFSSARSSRRRSRIGGLDFSPAEWLVENLVAYWKMDGNSEISLEADLTGKENTLLTTSEETIPSVDTGGKLSNARLFDGNNQYLYSSSTSYLQITDNGFFVACWFFPLGANQPILSKEFDGAEWYLAINETQQLEVEINSANGTQLNIEGVVLNDWNLGIFRVFNQNNGELRGQTLSLILNNSTAAAVTLNSPAQPGLGDLYVGASSIVHGSPTQFFSGLIDDTFIAKSQPNVVAQQQILTNTINVPIATLGGDIEISFNADGFNSNHHLVINYTVISARMSANVASGVISSLNSDSLFSKAFVASSDGSNVIVTFNDALPNDPTASLVVTPLTEAGLEQSNSTITTEGSVAETHEPLTTEQFQLICNYLWNDGAGRALY